MHPLSLGVSGDVIPILSTITNQPIERVVSLLNHASIINLHWRLAILRRRPGELAGRRRLTTKPRVSDSPMDVVNLLVGGVNLGITTKSHRSNELCDWVEQGRQHTLDKLQVAKLLWTRQVRNQTERPEQRKQSLSTPCRVDALLLCRRLREEKRGLLWADDIPKPLASQPSDNLVS